MEYGLWSMEYGLEHSAESGDQGAALRLHSGTSAKAGQASWKRREGNLPDESKKIIEKFREAKGIWSSKLDNFK